MFDRDAARDLGKARYGAQNKKTLKNGDWLKGACPKCEGTGEHGSKDCGHCGGTGVYYTAPTK